MRRCLLAALCGALVLGATACGGGGGLRFPAQGVLFVRNTKYGPSQIYRWRPGAAEPVPVGPKKFEIWDVARSPNGKRIAFGWDEGPGTAGVIDEMQASGRDAHTIISGGGFSGVFAPVWSPDGAQILYLRGYDGVPVVFSTATGDKESLHGTGINTTATWGKAGIAYAMGGTIKVFPPGAAVPEVFAKAKRAVGQVAWVSGGRLAALPGDASRLVIYSPRGRPQARLTVPGPGTACGIVSSPNGRELLIPVAAGHSLIGSADLWVTDLAGKHWTRLPIRGGGSCSVSWG